MKRLSTEIKELSEMSAYKLPTPTARQTGRLTCAELEELNNRIADGVIEAVARHTVYTPEIEREFVMEMVERMKSVPLEFGDFKMPPPKVTSVSYSPENGYIVHVDQNLPIIPNWEEIKASFDAMAFNDEVSSQEGDIVDIQGETFECVSEGVATPFNSPIGFPIDQPSGEVIIAPGGPFFFSPRASLVGFTPSPADGPRGPVGSPGASGQPGIPEVYPTPTLLRSSSTKPLMYSVDVYRSLKDAQYVAISSFPISDINSGNRIKPYAVGTTVQEALNKLAESIRGWTGRKELGVINEHMYITQWVCIHCTDVRGYPTKQELIDHIGLRHGGNLSVEKYTNSPVTNVWLKLP